MTRHQPGAGGRVARLGWRAAAGALLGTMVITGPWSLTAAGHDGLPAGPAPDGGYEGPVVLDLWAGLGRSTLAGDWTAPVSGYRITAGYGIPGSWSAGYHTGVDFATPIGTTVHSVGPGTVVSAGYSESYGNAVVTEMSDGYHVLYAHLSVISVDDGEQVTGGTKIGETGDTGRTTGPHLHFEVRARPEYGSDVDPLAYLARHGVTMA